MAVFRPKSNKHYYTNFVVDGKRYCENTHETTKRKAQERERDLKQEKVEASMLAKKIDNEIDAIEQVLKKRTGKTLDLKSVTSGVKAIELALQINTGKTIDLEALHTSEDFIEALHRVKFGHSLPKLPIREAWTAYQESPRRTRNQNTKTQSQYKGYWRKFTDWLESCHPNVSHLGDVTSSIAMQYMTVVKSRGVTDRTFNSWLLFFRHIFRVLKEDAGIHKNPFESVPMHEFKRNTVSRIDFSVEQLRSIQKAVSDDDDMRRFLMVLCYTGLRAGDGVLLSWNSIDLEQGMITVQTAKTRKTVQIPIMSTLKAELLNVPTKKGKLFPRLASEYRKDKTAVGKKFKAILKKAGVESRIEEKGRLRKASLYDLHSFRHTFAAICGRNHIPIAVVQSILGHDDPKTTEIYMNHASVKDKQQAVNTIPSDLFTVA